MINHPNAISVRRSVEIDNNAVWTSIVEVVTDLELDALNPSYDETAMNSLIEATVNWGAANSTSWDKLRVVGDN